MSEGILNYFQNTDPRLLALHGLLAGASVYGGSRLLKDLENASRPKETDSDLQIDIPRNHLSDFSSKVASAEKQANSDPGLISSIVGGGASGVMGGTLDTMISQLTPLLAFGGGAYGGYKGLSSAYEGIKGKQLEDELARQKKEYTDQLMQHKSAAATPLTDAFCEALEKKAEELYPSFAQEAGQVAHAMGQGFVHSGLGQASVLPLSIMLALGYGGSHLLGQRMKEKDTQNSPDYAKLPEHVKVNVV